MKTIKDVLQIDVSQHGDSFIADAKVLSGTPPIGRGQTEYEALYDLLAKLMFQIGTQDLGHVNQWTNAIKNFWREF